MATVPAEAGGGGPELALAALVLTYQDEVHIGRCIERLKPLTRRILVVDSFSTDRTVEIARQAGAEVVQHAFDSHAAQYNWAIEQIGTSADWLLWIDSDEYLEPPLIEEIRRRLPRLSRRVAAAEFRRKVIFKGRWIRWGGYYPVTLRRIWRQGQGFVEQRWMDPHLAIRSGETIRFTAGDVVDENLKDITEWTSKHNLYSTRQMVDFLSLELPIVVQAATPSELNRSAGLKRTLRNHLYRRTPLLLRAWLYFFLRYVLLLGFLDGKMGFVFHTLQGFWNFLLVDVKIHEARQYIARHGLEAFKAHLAARHGIRLSDSDEGAGGRR